MSSDLYPDGFQAVPNALIKSGVSAGAIGVYAQMGIKPPGWVFHRGAMAREAQVGRRALAKYIHELRQLGFLDIADARDERGQFVSVMRPTGNGGPLPETAARSRNRQREAETGNAKPPTVDRPRRAVSGRLRSDLIDQTLKGERDAPSPSMPSGPGSSQSMGDFERFWSVYPKQQAKAAAKRAWLQLKPDLELVERILQAVADQKGSAQWKDDAGEYIPFASNWLSGRRWEDVVQADSEGDGMPQSDLTDADLEDMERHIAAGKDSQSWTPPSKK